MKKVGFWNWFGLFIGVAAIITGIVILIICALNVAPYSSFYDTAYVKYGADLYTDLAQHLRSVNNTVGAIYDYVSGLLTSISGIAFIFAGLLVMCHYGKQISLSRKADNDRIADVKTNAYIAGADSTTVERTEPTYNSENTDNEEDSSDTRYLS